MLVDEALTRKNIYAGLCFLFASFSLEIWMEPFAMFHSPPSPALLRESQPLRFHLHVIVNIIFFNIFTKNAEFWSGYSYI